MSEERHRELTEGISESLMTLLVAVYESKTVAGVHMQDVMKVYGLSGSQLDAFDKQYISFKTDAWKADYEAFKKSQATAHPKKTPREILSTDDFDHDTDMEEEFNSMKDRKGGILH